jgi:hypothetical protein
MKALCERKEQRQTPELIVYNVRNAMAVHVILSSEEHYLWTTDSVRTSQALNYISTSYWKERNLSEVSYLVEDTLLHALKVKNNVMQVGNYRIARVGYYKDAPLPSVVPDTPLDVDALLLQRGSTVPLSQLLRYYSPAVLILDASLSYQRKQEYYDAAQEVGLVAHDIAENGAFRVPI